MKYAVTLRNWVDVEYIIEEENEEEAALTINDADPEFLAKLEHKEVYCYYGTIDIKPAPTTP